ncbi:MAG: hypothetical protein IJZ89_05640 [Clostridia bacterium]|nr:hypothetical protein [Clostridia bacterium]
MGFGLLFFGYAAAFLMSLNSFGFIFRLTGCAIMLSGLSKLTAYERRFSHAQISCVLLALSALAESIATLLFDYSTFSVSFISENTKNISYSVFLALAVIFHFFIYRAIHKISKDVGIEKISTNSVRFAVFFCIELVLLAAALLTWHLEAPFAKYVFMAAILYPFLIVVLNLSLFYSCYKNICEEGDEEAPRRQSRIPFLNKLFDASEKREQEIFEKTKSYAENRIRQENEIKKNKKSKKKKRR